MYWQLLSSFIPFVQPAARLDYRLISRITIALHLLICHVGILFIKPTIHCFDSPSSLSLIVEVHVDSSPSRCAFSFSLSFGLPKWSPFNTLILFTLSSSSSSRGTEKMCIYYGRNLPIIHICQKASSANGHLPNGDCHNDSANGCALSNTSWRQSLFQYCVSY